MKICRVVDTFPTEGEIKGDLGPNYYNYAKLSAKKGNEEYILCQRRDNQPREEVINGIHIVRVSQAGKNHGLMDLLFGEFGKNSLDEVKRIKPDIVSGHNIFGFYLARHKKDLEEMGTKLVTHLHVHIDGYKYAEQLPLTFDLKTSVRDRMMGRIYFRLFKYVCSRADLVIACDKYTKNSVLRYCPHQPVEVVYNGADYERFVKTDSDLKETYNVDHLLMDIGRPVPWKGMHYLVQALAQLNREYKNLYLLLIGVKREGFYDPYYQWLLSFVEKLGLSNVEFIFRVTHYDLPKYYSAADCFVAPSYPDPSPKTVYEAQSCSCPVAATNGGGIPEIFGEESGLLFEPRNVKDMVEKIRIILDNPDRFRGGREIIKEKATWEKCVEDLVKVYEGLAGRPCH